MASRANGVNPVISEHIPLLRSQSDYWITVSGPWAQTNLNLSILVQELFDGE
jgi:hypothetical protein